MEHFDDFVTAHGEGGTEGHASAFGEGVDETTQTGDATPAASDDGMNPWLQPTLMGAPVPERQAAGAVGGDGAIESHVARQDADEAAETAAAAAAAGQRYARQWELSRDLLPLAWRGWLRWQFVSSDDSGSGFLTRPAILAMTGARQAALEEVGSATGAHPLPAAQLPAPVLAHLFSSADYVHARGAHQVDEEEAVRFVTELFETVKAALHVDAVAKAQAELVREREDTGVVLPLPFVPVPDVHDICCDDFVAHAPAALCAAAVATNGKAVTPHILLRTRITPAWGKAVVVGNGVTRAAVAPRTVAVAVAVVVVVVVVMAVVVGVSLRKRLGAGAGVDVCLGVGVGAGVLLRTRAAMVAAGVAREAAVEAPMRRELLDKQAAVRAAEMVSLARGAAAAAASVAHEACAAARASWCGAAAAVEAARYETTALRGILVVTRDVAREFDSTPPFTSWPRWSRDSGKELGTAACAQQRLAHVHDESADVAVGCFGVACADATLQQSIVSTGLCASIGAGAVTGAGSGSGSAVAEERGEQLVAAGAAAAESCALLAPTRS
eukprot:g2006.t1